MGGKKTTQQQKLSINNEKVDLLFHMGLASFSMDNLHIVLPIRQIKTKTNVGPKTIGEIPIEYKDINLKKYPTEKKKYLNTI